MNELQVFSYEGNEVRTVQFNCETWWVLKDVCDVLGIHNYRNVTARLDDDEKGVHQVDTLGGSQETTIINESGLYNVILRSDKPEAKKFKRWVTHDVLPAIRRHGLYAAEDLLANPDLLIQAATALKEERAKSAALTETISIQNQQIAEMKPKAGYYDIILACKDAVAVTTIAKDYGKSGKWMNEYLHSLGVQYKQGNNIWLLYQKHAEHGYTCTRTHNYTGTNGEQRARVHTYWTQKGRLFIYGLLKSNGVLPLIEQRDFGVSGNE